jgi:DNA-binding transcriptional regulator YdaS (Cro superfamily)
MRASIEGARLLAKGVDRQKVKQWVLWRGRLSPEKIRAIENKVR